jgi:hypothetical protein
MNRNKNLVIRDMVREREREIGMETREAESKSGYQERKTERRRETERNRMAFVE